jgi:ATP-dependent DNA helicase RecQ
MVADGKYVNGRFDDTLVSACVDMIREWNPQPAPQWVTCIPSLKRPELVPDFARRLAAALRLEFKPSLCKIIDNLEQKTQANSYQQAHNLDGVFSVDPMNLSPAPCLLVDDMTDSGWTFTVAAALLRRAGCQTVFPLALALNSTGMD